jgi:hypothetical protein
MSGMDDMGDDIHDLVHAFADGELEPAEAEAFREHLGTCEQCQAELDDILQLQALSGRLASMEAKKAPAPETVAPSVEAARPVEAARRTEDEAASSRAFRPAWSRRKRVGLSVVLGGALAAAFALAVLRTPGLDGGTPETLALAPTRSTEARLSYGGASGWRPYGVKRSGNERPMERVPLETQAKLEKAGDLHGLATTFLLQGEKDQAAEYLGKLSASPDVDSDRAVVALSKGALEEALILLEGVLEKAPNHAPALWNRGLVLRELGLDLLAAESFGKVAALNEPGWSDEARERKAQLERQGQERHNRWKAVWDAGKRMVADGTLLTDSQVRDAPPMARRYFYLSAWTAPTPERVLALRPVAQALDAHYGGKVLESYLERTAKRDFAKRAPLAATFAQVLGGKLDATAGEAFVRQLQAAGEQDILLGALSLLGMLPARVDLYASAANALGDPWFLMSAQLQRAQAQLAASELGQVEATLRSALPECERQKLDYRCAELEQMLAELYIVEHRLSEGRELARKGLTRAKQMNDAGMEVRLLQNLGQIARFQKGFALMRAYLQESALREPDYCPTQILLHETLATVRMFELRPADARSELENTPQCGAARTLLSAFVLADLARVDPKPGDVEKVLAMLNTLRASGTLRAGMKLTADHLEGRVRLLQDRAAGQRILREVISASEKLPREETAAQKARAASYSMLILDAGKAGEYAAALDLFTEQVHAPAPARCVLGVELAFERTLVAARGAGGEVVGAYDADRRTLDFDVEKLVPEPVLAALRPCEQVQVFASYPLHGRAGLLPPSIAWSYRWGPEHPAPAAAGTPRRLVVSDVDAPASLGLPRLSPWAPAPEAPASTVLSGAQATPSRVLAEMVDADEIDIHAHGLVNLGVSDASLIVLSPQPDGRYALTAGEVRRQRLKRAPVVLLASCRAAQTVPYLHEPWSLPTSFLDAGARAVIASPTDIPDAEAGRFFEAVRARLRAGEPPAVAVRNERMSSLAREPQSWVRTVVIFE